MVPGAYENAGQAKYSEGLFEPQTGVRLFERWYEPLKPARACVVILHGLAEHGGRYEHVARFLVRSGYTVGVMDLRGHGKSEGRRSYIEDFDAYLQDLDAFLAQAAGKPGGGNIFLLGHSLGTSVALKYLLTRPAVRVCGAVLSGSMVMLGESVPAFLTKVISLMDALAPGLPVIKLDGGTISRDPAVVARYDSDPLNYRGKLSARTGAQINKMFQYLQANMNRVGVPLLILQGSEDRLVNPAGSRLLYAQAAAPDKTLRVYEGLYHEILNEPEKEQVLAEITAWLDAHV